MAELILSPQAEEDLDGIWLYIAKDHPVNADRFIDKCFLEGLVEDSRGECHYCHTEIQYKTYNKTLATIERLDNSIGHLKSNCVIACLPCNCKHTD